MLPQLDTIMSHNLLEYERLNIIKAVEDIFYAHKEPQTRGAQVGKRLTSQADLNKQHSLTRMPASFLHHMESCMHYELINIVPVRGNLAIVKVLQTPLDKDGEKLLEGVSSPLLVIAKSGDEWEMVGLPLPLHCLLSQGHAE